ncbi:MAG: FecR domain-containing protein [Steroidobacteraceae bacterium]|nr:FecR domain-containing protein [Steroidobacteraceae bacterium]
MTIREEAVRWRVLRDQRKLTAAEARAFSEWLQDPRHAAAYEEAARSWALIRPDAGNARLERLRAEALALAPAPPRSWYRPALAAAAVGVLAVGAALIWYRASTPAVRAPVVASAGLTTMRDYVTAKGERLEITLPDGSNVSLNTDTALDVEFSEGQRLVRLRRGQAIFSVAKDSARPFLVQAGDRQVRATGTLFDVYLAQDRLQVVLAEGEVIVTRLHSGERAARPVRLSPGQALVARPGAADEVQTRDARRALRWRDGFVEFNDTSLAEAVAEMNRYSDRPVVLRDARTGALRISGVFRTDEPEQFLNVIQEVLPVRVHTSPDGQAEIAGR